MSEIPALTLTAWLLMVAWVVLEVHEHNSVAFTSEATASESHLMPRYEQRMQGYGECAELAYLSSEGGEAERTFTVNGCNPSVASVASMVRDVTEAVKLAGRGDARNELGL